MNPLRSNRRFIFSLLLVVNLFFLTAPSYAVHIWSRRYSIPCGTCHATPGLQLTATGLDFFRRGHRFENDTFDKDLTHLLSGHIEWQQEFAKGESTAFSSPEFHLHAGGALSPQFSVYLDVNINQDFESVYGQYTVSHGEDTYFTARLGKISPTIIRNYGNGIMASASTPLILTDTTLADNPFTPARDSFGLNVAGRLAQVYLEAGVVNGEDVAGQAAVKNHKDLYATAEYALPDGLSGLGVYLYRGGYDLGSEDTGLLFDRYDRTGLFANYTKSAFRLAGAYLWGKDRVNTLSDRKIHGYYAQADTYPGSVIAPFLRYDEVKTEDENDNDRIRKGTLGASIKVFETEVTASRLALEVFRKKEAGASGNGALIDIWWAF